MRAVRNHAPTSVPQRHSGTGRLRSSPPQPPGADHRSRQPNGVAQVPEHNSVRLRSRRDPRRTRGGAGGGGLSDGSSWSGTSDRAHVPGAAAPPGGKSGLRGLGLRLPLGAEAAGTCGTREGLFPFRPVITQLRTAFLPLSRANSFSLLPSPLCVPSPVEA